jgi:hypothetical protein
LRKAAAAEPKFQCLVSCESSAIPVFLSTIGTRAWFCTGIDGDSTTSSSAGTPACGGEPPQHSESPRRRRPSSSPVLQHRGRTSHHDQSAAPPRMVREVSRQFPLLTKTNYSDWSAMMCVMLHARGLWAAVKEGATDEVKDQMAMEALLRGVPLEMAASLAVTVYLSM